MRTPDQPDAERVFRDLAGSIGGTPLLAIQCNFRGKSRTIYAKAEQLNLTGSIKDRVALQSLWTAYESGNIQPGYAIAEATGGNTGVSYSAIGRALGHQVTVFMRDSMGEERESLLLRFGATVVPLSPGDAGLQRGIEKSDQMAEGRKVFLPHQFSDLVCRQAHEQSTGPEIWYQLKARELRPDAFVAGVGTGGTVMGVGRFLRSKNPAIRVHPLAPKGSPTLSKGGEIRKHRIQGISDEFVPRVLDGTSLDPVVQVSDGDAVLMARALAAQLGFGVGISSGANFLGALRIQEELGQDAVVATVFPDDAMRYSETDLLGNEPIEDHFVSSEVDLLGYDTLRLSCKRCTDLEECRHWVAAIGSRPEPALT